MPTIADIYEELPEATFDPATDILEMIGNDQPGGGDTFSLESAEAVLVYIIEWRKARSFIRWLLGFSYADSGTPYRLYRENPQTHPVHGTLTAATVHLAGVAPEPDFEVGVPEGAPNFPAIYGDIDIHKTTKYQRCFATARFVHRPWAFLEDSTVETYHDEIIRNVYAEPRPTIEMLSGEGPNGQMKWAETAADGPIVDAFIPTPFGTLVGKTAFQLHWMWVPEQYLSNDPFFFSPDNVLRVMANVNSTKFAAWGPGTIQAMPPTFERFVFPISTSDGQFPFYGWNITIPCVRFQPRPRGTLAASTADILLAAAPTDATLRATAEAQPDGYRLMAWPHDLKWYPVVRKNGTSYLYPETDLYGMFRHINDPS